MTDTMTGAEIASTRTLLGLTQVGFAEMLGVSRQAVRDWERGTFQARPGVVADILALRATHDTESARLIAGARDGVPIELPSGPKPSGWYLALGARVIAAVPDAMLDWYDGD